MINTVVNNFGILKVSDSSGIKKLFEGNCNQEVMYPIKEIKNIQDGGKNTEICSKSGKSHFNEKKSMFGK